MKKWRLEEKEAKEYRKAHKKVPVQKTMKKAEKELDRYSVQGD